MEPQDLSTHGMTGKFRKLFSKDGRKEQRSQANSCSSSAPIRPLDGQTVVPFPIGPADWIDMDDADVDICFIHGLTGNRDSTWTAKGQHEPWPKVFLPEELSGVKARILTYGYDAYIVRRGHASSNQMIDHATNLLQRLTSHREKSRATGRPLILIAHSLGGLIVKQAILMSKGSPEAHLKDLYDMTQGIIFMGTPHSGSWIADWVKIPIHVFGVLKSTNASLLQILQTDDQLLRSLNHDFLSLLRTLREDPETRKTIMVTCFYEEIGYPKIGKIVSRESATFAADTPICIHANHSDMVKFATSEDDGFQSIAGEIRRWTKDPSKATPTPLFYRGIWPGSFDDPIELALAFFKVPRTESARKYMKLCMKHLALQNAFEIWLQAECNTAKVSDKDARKKFDETGMKIEDCFSRAVGQCRRSLVFDGMMERQETIARPEDKTCQWVYQDLRYLEWLKTDSSILWIKGHPGSGKSTLIKSMKNQHQDSIHGDGTYLLHHFFNARGRKIERSPEAMYRTLLHSLSDMDPSVMCQLLGIFLEKKARSTRVRWSVNELAGIFHDSIERTDSHDVLVFIDALDECSDKHVLGIVRLFERSVQIPRNSSTLRVVWSSRFYPQISLVAATGIDLILNENNSGDIRRHIQNTLPTESSESLGIIGEEIISRAKGNFLWDSLIANMLNKAWNAGDDSKKLKDVLRIVPDDLQQLFLYIFQEPSYSAEQRKDLRDIALLIFGASRPLTIHELYTCLSLNTSESLEDAVLPQKDIEQFRKRMMHASGGLIEVVQSQPLPGLSFASCQTSLPWADLRRGKTPLDRSDLSSTTRVQVIHESIREFFLGKGLQLLHATSRDAFLADCNARLTKLGIECLSKVDFCFGGSTKDEGNERITDIDATIDLVLPRSLSNDLWRSPQVAFLENYVRRHIFTHFDATCQALMQGTQPTSSLPSARICRKALLAYLRIACSEFSRRDRPMHYHTTATCEQLRLLRDYGDTFEYDSKEPFATLLDLPIRVMAMTRYLRDIGLYFIEKNSATSARKEDLRHFLAIFSATEGHENPETPFDWKSTWNAATGAPTNLASNNAERDSSQSSQNSKATYSFWSALSFSVPHSSAEQLWPRHRLFLYEAIDKWRVLSASGTELRSLLPDHTFQTWPRSQLVYPDPFTMGCVVCETNLAEGAQPTIIQSGKGSFEWERIIFSPRTGKRRAKLVSLDASLRFSQRAH